MPYLNLRGKHLRQFCDVIVSENIDRPHVSEMLSDSKISTLESGLKNFRICLRIRRMRVDDCRIRKERVADSKISGYVWTGPKSMLYPIQTFWD